MRSIDDIAILKYYLTHSNLTDKFKNDGIDPLNYDKMIIISSTYVNYVHVDKGKMLYDYHSNAKFTYVIALGEISLYSPKEIVTQLTGYEYFEKIMEIYKDGNIPLLEKTIGINQPVYKVNYADVKFKSTTI